MYPTEFYEDTARRVWEGRRALYDLNGIDPSVKDTFVVVSEARHRGCLIELRRRVRQPIGILVPIEEVIDPALPERLTVYGMPLVPAADIDDDEIRFRAEVSV